MAFSDGVVVLVDKGKATDNIYLDLCKAFGIVPATSLPVLETDGFEGWTICRQGVSGKVAASVVAQCPGGGQ